VIQQGEIWWADLAEPRGSEPGYRRPVVIVQGEAFNRSRIATVICAIITSNLRLAKAPGNVFLSASESGLPKDSVVNVSQVITLDRTFLAERVGLLRTVIIDEIVDGIELVLGR